MVERYLQTPIMHRAVVHNGIAFLGGVTAEDRSLPMAGQTEQVCQKLEQILTEAGSDKSKLLSATIFISDFGLKDEMNAVWRKWLSASDLPARATIGAGDLGEGVLIEIVATAAV